VVGVVEEADFERRDAILVEGLWWRGGGGRRKKRATPSLSRARATND
jgi:hypothetical protein